MGRTQVQNFRSYLKERVDAVTNQNQLKFNAASAENNIGVFKVPQFLLIKLPDRTT